VSVCARACECVRPTSTAPAAMVCVRSCVCMWVRVCACVRARARAHARARAGVRARARARARARVHVHVFMWGTSAIFTRVTHIYKTKFMCCVHMCVFMCCIRAIFMCVTHIWTHMCMCDNICVLSSCVCICMRHTCYVHVCDMTYSIARYKSLLCVTWLCVWRDSFIRAPWFLHTLWYDSFTWVHAYVRACAHLTYRFLTHKHTQYIHTCTNTQAHICTHTHTHRRPSICPHNMHLRYAKHM